MPLALRHDAMSHTLRRDCRRQRRPVYMLWRSAQRRASLEAKISDDNIHRARDDYVTPSLPRYHFACHIFFFIFFMLPLPL